jgi:multidrug efflux pump
VPLRQIASFEYTQEYPIVWRRDRIPTLTVQADVAPGLLPAMAVKAVQPSIDRLAATLPSGYRIVPGDRSKRVPRPRRPCRQFCRRWRC